MTFEISRDHASADLEANISRLRAHLDTRDVTSAEALVQGLLKTDPTQPDVLSLAAEFHQLRSEPFRAIRYLEEAIFYSDRPKELHRQMADVLLSINKFGHGRRYLRKVLREDPSDIDALQKILIKIMSVPKHQEEIAADFDELERRDASALEPTMYLNAGYAKWLIGDLEEAHRVFMAGYEKFADHPELLTNAFSHGLPFVYESQAELEQKNRRYDAELAQLEDRCEADPKALVGVVKAASSAATAYRLAYNGRNGIALQRRFGRLLSRATQHQFPQLQKPAATQRPYQVPNPRVRVGVVGGFFKDHASWRNRRGFFYHLDRKKYNLFLYDLSTQPAKDFDDVTASTHGAFDTVRQGASTLEQWARLIAQDRLDFIVYPELGMNPMAQCLAAMRLAPVQARMAGHPFTCGFPTIDDILTSDFMEPADAQDHYTENVVRLAGTGFYRYPSSFDRAELTREDFDLDPDTFYIFYGHNITKYLPEDDDLVVEMARALPTAKMPAAKMPAAKMIVLRDSRAGFQKTLEERWQAAFNAAGLNLHDHILFMNKQPTARFLALIHACDVYLDCPAWNGDNVTVDALRQDRPIVTAPGAFMRSRHSAAFLRQMGLQNYVCANKEEMIAMVVRLANDPDFYKTYQAAIATHRHRIFCEQAALDSFRAYLEESFTTRRSV